MDSPDSNHFPDRPKPRVRPQYAKVVRFLRPRLNNLPGKIVAIDGWPGVGKTTLGRYLAWCFNIALIETDFFLLRGRGTLVHRKTEIRRLIDHRVRKTNVEFRRPVIVEGAAILRLLSSIKRDPDYLVYLENSKVTDAADLTDELAAYEAEWTPKARAHVSIRVDW